MVAWLAFEESEPARAAEARAGLAAAGHFSLRWGAAVREALPAAPADIAPYLRLQLLVWAIGIEAAVPMPSAQPLLRLCAPPLQAGSEELARCSALATVLVEHSDALLGHGLGTRIAERAGWPAARLAALRAERERMEQASMQLPFDEKQPLSCDSVERMTRLVDERAQYGELGHLKRKAALHERR